MYVGAYLNLFLETKNPLYALRALHNALRLNYPIPKEVCNYIATAANEIVRVAQNPPKPSRRPVAIARALKLHKDEAGQGSVFTEFSTRQRNREIALATEKRIAYYGLGKEDYAYDDIAGEYEVSKSTVRRNYKTHQKRWRLTAERLVETGAITYGPNGKPRTAVFGDPDDLREAAAILREAERIKNG
jgi:hypothetical protein